jgi:hypothetical protein
MHEVLLFGEDDGHAIVLGALVRRLAEEQDVPIHLDVRFARGGYGPLLSELRRFVRDLAAGQQTLPDLLLVGRDGNCQGYVQAREAVAKVLTDYGGPVAIAVPDPHIERWLLLDPAAFKQVLGKGCPAPDLKCEKDRYKEQLLHAIRDAGLQPVLGGLEYAEELIQALHLSRVGHADASFGHLLRDLRQQVNQWKPE